VSIPDTLMKPSDWKSLCNRMIYTHQAKVMIAVLDSCDGNPHTVNTVKAAEEMLQRSLDGLVVNSPRGELPS